MAMPTRDDRIGRSEKRWNKQTAAPGERLAGKLDDGVNAAACMARILQFSLMVGS